MSVQTTDLGKVMITPKGEYNQETAYTDLDVITHQGNSYLVLTDVIGVTPTDDGVHYQLLAQKGDTGAQGPQGNPGADGADGAQGPQGEPGKSAYEIAVEHGFSGEEEDFNNALTNVTVINNRVLAFGPQTVATSAWAEDATQTDYGFRAAVPIEGVTANYTPDVRFCVDDATSGILSPVASSYDGGVYIYASETPAAEVKIESVVCTYIDPASIPPVVEPEPEPTDPDGTDGT